MHKKFPDPMNVAVFTTKYVLEQSPILYVYHDEEDGAWQLHSAESPVPENDARIVGLEDMIEMDHSILELTDMPMGYCAYRENEQSEWIITKNENMKTEQIEKNENLIGYCGIYCGACPSFTSGKCEGCRAKSEKSAVRYKKCEVKKCCVENGFFTCADCTIYASTKECKKYNPLILKIAGWIESTDRSKAIEMIKIKGLAETVAFMDDKQWACFKVKDSFLNKRYGKRVNE